jgi:hypothetical protein
MLVALVVLGLAAVHETEAWGWRAPSVRVELPRVRIPSPDWRQIRIGNPFGRKKRSVDNDEQMLQMCLQSQVSGDASIDTEDVAEAFSDADGQFHMGLEGVWEVGVEVGCIRVNLQTLITTRIH